MASNNLLQRALRAPVRIPRKLAAWSAMALFLSRPGQALWRRRLLRQQADGPLQTLPSSACVAHVYYVDLLPEIIACWRTFPSSAPLFVTVPDDRLEPLQKALHEVLSAAELTRVIPVPSPNRGRDIAQCSSSTPRKVLTSWTASCAVA
jgi:lipopolysaccharide biosynthesis protein